MGRALTTGLVLAAVMGLGTAGADAAHKHKKHHRHKAATEASAPTPADKRTYSAEEKIQRSDSSMEKSLKNICTNC
jgi:hypothetical protein